MRPSSTSFESVSFATSRLTPSKEERTTAWGVSSMMKSTPVRFSRERMFRPSRPMIRPFMSSDGSSTSETVVSAAWLAATRWSASPTRARARRLVTDELLGALEELALRVGRREARDPLELAELRVLRRLELLLELPHVGLAVRDSLLLPLELGERPLELLLLRPDALLGLDRLGAPVGDLPLDVGAEAQRLFTRLD